MKKNFKIKKPIFRPYSYKDYERNIKKIWLDKNENTDEVINNFFKKEFLNQIPPRYLYSYPSLAETYAKVSKFCKKNKNQILLTHGSDGGIKTIFESIVKQNDKVIIFSPTFEMYDVYCKLYQAKYKTINYSIKDKKIYLNFSRLFKTLKEFKPKLICFASPDSPTGFFFNQIQVKKILEFSKKNNIFVLIDEAYYLFSEKTYINEINKYKNLAIIRSMGKAFGVAGLRVGFIVSNKINIDFFRSYRGMYEINNIAAYMLNKILTKKGIKEVKNSVNRLIEGKKFFLKNLKKNPNIEFIDTHANFIHLKILKDKNKIIKKINEICVFKKRQKHPILKDYIRLSLTTKKNFINILKVLNHR